VSRNQGSNALDERELSEGDFRQIVKLVYDATGIVLDDSRKALVVGRLAPRLRAVGAKTYREYLDYLQDDDAAGEELVRFVNRITTNKTSFFREAHHFAFLREQLEQRRRRAQLEPSLRKVRIWSAGCSTGEEPYSIALTVAEAFGSELPQWDIKILATDIDTDVLALARRGIYPTEVTRGIPPHLSGFMEEVVADGRVGRRVHEHIQKLITFEQLNFMSSSWPIRHAFDFLFCRNVTIYFDRPTQDKLYRRFAALLARDGFFFAGHSENLSWLPDVFALGGSTIYHHPGASKEQGGLRPPLTVISSIPPARGPARSVVAAAPVRPVAVEAPASPPAGPERGATPEVAIQAGGVIASKTPLLIKTTLGSCISVCLYDPVTRMGGMNHFMLPGVPGDAEGSTRFGVHAMEVLINRLLKLGASRHRLVAKIAGGCSVVDFSSGISVAERNQRFVEDFLAGEGFEVKARRVGGTHAMEVRFRTDTGDAFVRTVMDPGVIKRALRQDADYREAIALPVLAPTSSSNANSSTDDDGITWFR